MGKAAALAVILIAAYFAFRPGDATSADKCLAESGATVTGILHRCLS